MLELNAFGTLDLRRGGRRLDKVLAQPKRAALLVYLGAATPLGYHARDTVLALLWPDSDQRRARASLRKALHFLTRHVGKGVIHRRGDDLALSREQIEWDVRAFREAIEAGRERDAVELYRGELLPGFHVSAAPGFERWLEEQRRDLGRQAVAAAWRLAEREERSGHALEAAWAARRAVGLDPLDESGVRRLMALLDRLGDRAGALRAYEQAAGRIERELDLPPSGETRALAEAIRDRARAVGASIEGEGNAREGGPIAVFGTRDGIPDEAPDDAPDGPVGSTHDEAPVEGRPASLRPWRRRHAHTVAAVVGAVLVAGLGLGRLPGRTEAIASSAPALDRQVAVLPFRVVGADPEVWSDGMVDVLSASLHGTMGLEAREPTYVLKLWQSEFRSAVPTAETAREAARQIGVGWVITGSLLQHRGQIRLSGEAHRLATGSTVGPVVVDGPQDSLFTVLDRFVLELLRAGLAPPEEGLLPVEIGRITTTSITALEAYLEGERAWRSAELRQAADAWERAVRHDSAFALAQYRLGIAYARVLGDVEAVGAQFRAALRHGERLHERESALVRAGLALHEGRLEEGVDTLRALTQRDPSFAEGWLRLGNALLAHGPRLLVPTERFREALADALQKNPMAAEPYWGLIEDAFFRLDSVRARELTREYARVDPLSDACIGYRTAFELAWGDATEFAAAKARLGSLEAGPREPLSCAMVALELAPPLRPALDLVAEEVASPTRPLAVQRSPALFLYRSNVRAGRLEEGRTYLEELYRRPARKIGARRIALLDLIGYPQPAAVRRARTILMDAPEPPDWFWLGQLAIRDDRPDDVERSVGALRAGGTPAAVDLAHALELLAAWKRGDPVDPTRLGPIQARLPRELGNVIPQWLRWRAGAMLLQQGRAEEALRYLESFNMDAYLFTAPSLLLRGRAYELTGDIVSAAEVYRRFARWWADADPPLKPCLQSAREALATLREGANGPSAPGVGWHGDASAPRPSAHGCAL